MKTLLPSRFLQRVLLADAVTSVLVAALQLAFAHPLANMLGLPQALLFETGLFLVGYALLLLWLARGRPAPAALLWLLVIGNAGWALGCLATALAAGPTSLGLAFLAVQALTVLAFAGLEMAGIKGSARSAGSGLRAAMGS